MISGDSLRGQRLHATIRREDRRVATGDSCVFAQLALPRKHHFSRAGEKSLLWPLSALAEGESHSPCWL